MSDEPMAEILDQDVDRVLAVLADPLRWRIVRLLAEAERSTVELQGLLEAKQTLVSHHLKVLRDAELALTRPSGRFTYYRLRPGAFDGLHDAVALLAAAGRRGPRGASPDDRAVEAGSSSVAVPAAATPDRHRTVRTSR